jgi:hypothetical protein
LLSHVAFVGHPYALATLPRLVCCRLLHWLAGQQAGSGCAYARVLCRWAGQQAGALDPGVLCTLKPHLSAACAGLSSLPGLASAPPTATSQPTSSTPRRARPGRAACRLTSWRPLQARKSRQACCCRGLTRQQCSNSYCATSCRSWDRRRAAATWSQTRRACRYWQWCAPAWAKAARSWRSICRTGAHPQGPLLCCFQTRAPLHAFGLTRRLLCI